MVVSGFALATPTFAATPYYPLYYTAGYGGTAYREHAPLNVSSAGIAESNSTNAQGTAVSLSAGPGASAGFVLEGGELGTLVSKAQNPPEGLAMMQVKDSGSGPVTVHLWIDSNSSNDNATNGDWFDWSGPLSGTSTNTLMGLGGDQEFIGPTLSSKRFTLNGNTVFFDPANHQSYTLNQLQSNAGSSLGLSATDNVAVWIGVNGTAVSGASSTITGVKVDSTAVPLGQLPEVPYAAAMPLLAGVGVVGLFWYRKTAQRRQVT